MEEKEIAGGIAGILALIGGAMAGLKFWNRSPGGSGNPEGNRYKRGYVRFDPEDRALLSTIGQALVSMREDDRVNRAADLGWRKAHQDSTEAIVTGITELGKEFAELKGVLSVRR